MRKTTLLTLLTLLIGVSFSAHAQYGVKTTVLNEDGTVNGAKYEYYIVRPQGSRYVTATKDGTDAVELCTDGVTGTTKANFIFVETTRNGVTGLAIYATNILKDGNDYILAPVTIESPVANTAYKLTPNGTPALFTLVSQQVLAPKADNDFLNKYCLHIKLILDSSDNSYSSANNNTWQANGNTKIQYYTNDGANKFYVWKIASVDKTAPQMVFSSSEEGTLGTYSSPVAFSIPTGVKAYKVASTTPTDNTITLEEITGTVPAGKGIIIEQHGSSKVYDVKYSSETSSVGETNLVATTSASSNITQTSTDLKTVSTYNVASKQSTTGPIWVENSTSIYGLSGGTFYHLTNSNDATASYITLPPYKAYLVTTTSEGSTLKLQFPDGSTTSINAINAEGNSNAAVYDLSGRRVNKTAKGSLYIQNGKKFIAE